MLDALARVHFLSDELEQAVAVQRQTVALARDAAERPCAASSADPLPRGVAIGSANAGAALHSKSCPRRRFSISSSSFLARL